MSKYKLVLERDDPNRADKELYASHDLLEIARFCDSRVGQQQGGGLNVGLNGDDLL